MADGLVLLWMAMRDTVGSDQEESDQDSVPLSRYKGPCEVCDRITSPLWRKVKVMERTWITCNACGIYWRVNRTFRRRLEW